jgi:formylglycine-generating enzyme required for sulfatase activity
LFLSIAIPAAVMVVLIGVRSALAPEETPLIAAARAGDVPAIERLLSEEADSSQPGGVNGWTPLMHAIHTGQTGSVRALIAGGADVNVQVGDGITALMMAAGNGQTDMVRLLLDSGADPRIRDAHQATALDLALTGVTDVDHFTVTRCDTETVAALLESAPDLRPSGGMLDGILRRLKRCDEVERLLASPPRASREGSLAETITVELPGLPAGAKPLEMVLIHPGEFTMGSDGEQRGRQADWPAHRVTITRPFYMGRYEVTQAQWEVLMDRTRSMHRGSPDLPVEKTTWEDCRSFLRRLNDLGLGHFRLPSEAEWEYAARAGTATDYYFGEGMADAGQYMWWAGNNQPDATKEVGRKRPNAWGLYDMLGNVSEWCADRWEDAHVRGPQTDPTGPASGSRALLIFTNRVFRGGCYRCSAEESRAASRSYEQSSDFHYSLGFRLVRDAD